MDKLNYIKLINNAKTVFKIVKIVTVYNQINVPNVLMVII